VYQNWSLEQFTRLSDERWRGTVWSWGGWSLEPRTISLYIRRFTNAEFVGFWICGETKLDLNSTCMLIVEPTFKYNIVGSGVSESAILACTSGCFVIRSGLIADYNRFDCIKFCYIWKKCKSAQICRALWLGCFFVTLSVTPDKNQNSRENNIFCSMLILLRKFGGRYRARTCDLLGVNQLTH